MARQYTIPNEAVPYILFQRTDYLKLTYSLLFRACGKLLPAFTYNRRVALEARLRARSIKRLYLADMHDEYQSIKDYLPETCSNILDIGCGMAGIDLLLQRHYSATSLDLFLLDKSEVNDNVYYMYEARGSFYNSLSVATDLLIRNGIERDRVHTIEATDDNRIEIDRSLDLVISMISWGFHYPVETYLERVHALLRPGGTLILDVRKQTVGLDLIAQAFGGHTVLVETDKYQRVCAIKS